MNIEPQALLVLMAIMAIGLFGPIGVIIASHQSVSRGYLGIQVAVAGLLGAPFASTLWTVVFTWIPADQIKPDLVTGVLRAAPFITAGALGFTFTMTHILYSVLRWLVAEVELWLRELEDKHLRRPWIN